MAFNPNNYEGGDRLSHIESYLAQAAREHSCREARGIISESFPFAAAVNNTSPTASTAFGSMIGLQAGDRITNILTYCVTAQPNTVNQFALCDLAGTALAVTASQAGSIVGSTFCVAPLTSQFTVTTSGAYYAVGLMLGSATIPAMARSAGISGAAIGSANRPWIAGGAGISLLNSGTTSIAASSTAFWFGVS